jgi:hypothetical protein
MRRMTLMKIQTTPSRPKRSRRARWKISKHAKIFAPVAMLGDVGAKAPRSGAMPP